MPIKKVAALILSGIGGGIYLFVGIMFRVGWWSSVSPTLIAAGIISLIGTGIGAVRIKIGGVVILLSIPLSILIGISGGIYSILFVLIPVPFPHSILVMIGGILCEF
ncbi:MAG: hypothetical protein EAX91_01980 [Candidatus Lokiarchaeota archaeon]|nr:hypothetical protein [Candidatus Lokiarchaeota archaeon]